MILQVAIKSTIMFIYVSTDIASTSITFYTMAVRGLMSKLQRLLIVIELEETGIAEFIFGHGSHPHRLL